jgi:hypothetical protein
LRKNATRIETHGDKRSWSWTVLNDDQEFEIIQVLDATIAHCLMSGIAYVEILVVSGNGAGFYRIGGDRSAIKDEPDGLRYN